jgi:aminoglycoside phosphotransferase (APT) family kinase protein
MALNSTAIVEQICPGARIVDAAPLAGGVSAAVHGVDFVTPAGAIGRLVVRTHRDVAGKPDRAERAAREYALLVVLHARGMAVPRPRLFIPPETLVIDRIEGDTALPNDPAQALAKALAAIHRIAIAGLPALPVFNDPMPALHEWLPELAQHPRMRAGCGAYNGAQHLLHGDFWPGNVLWRAGELAAVLDWEDAALGDPLCDLACARVELARMTDDATAERFTRAYGRRCTIDEHRLRWWDVFVSTAALQYMDGWGLAPDILASRRTTASVWQARALSALGIHRVA